MKKVLGTIFIIIYAIIAIFVTLLLLSYNDYNISELGGYTFYTVNANLNDTYQKGSLLIISKSNQSDIEVGDKIFVYRTISNNEFEVSLDTVKNVNKTDNVYIYTLQDNSEYTISSIIGKESNTKVFKSVGTILSILESKWGYLFLVVIVTLLLFLQELYELVLEIKYGMEPEGSK